MFEYFEILDEQLGKRYRTLENNLRSASNSFFDSFREVVQELVRVIYRREGLRIIRADGTELEYSDRIELNKLLTSSSLVDRLSACGVETSVQEKLRDYIAKVNGHIHRREKEISFEGVVDYLTALYQYSSPYVSSIGLKCQPPSLNDINELYKEYERSLASLALYEESFVTRVQGIIEESKAESEVPRPSFEELVPKGACLDESISNDAFALVAERGLAYLGGKSALKRNKCIFYALYCGMVLCAILYLLLSGLYSLLFFGSLLSLIIYTITVIRSIPLSVEHSPLSNETIMMYDYLYNGNRLEGIGHINTIYLWGLLSSAIGFVLELSISYLSGVNKLLGFSYFHIFYVVFEVLAFIFGIMFLFNGYKVLSLKGTDSISGEKKTLYYYKGRYYNDLEKVGIDKT